ncbi:PQQ-binding-like beta-propeller repeat protein [Pistricoccus aurantiacus]|nr:PQQ-binding-like beta-propeller repeat protein [Pistricoccus aurantiacus]
MNVWKKHTLLTGCLMALTSSTLAAGFGPDEWTQYRLDATNNAVFSNGDAPLKRMKFRTGDQVRATPVIVDNALYIGNHATGGMFRFNLPEGKAAWHDDNPWFRHAPNWIHSEMIQSDGRIFVGYGNRAFQSEFVRGTGDSGVMAVDPEDGATLWSHATLGEVMPTPAMWDETLYITTGGGELLALDPGSGEQRWSLELPGWVSMSSPAIEDGVLYVGSLNSVIAVDLDNRDIRWRFDETASFTDVPPAVSDGIVVMTGMVGRHNLSDQEKRRYSTQRGGFHFIYAFDAMSGELLWEDLLGSGPHQPNNTSGAPAIADGKVFVGSPYARGMYAYDLKTGKRLWEHPTNAGIKGAPAITAGKVFFGDTAGFLYALDAEDGDEPRCENGQATSKMKLGGSSNAASATALAPGGPVVINNTVFVGSQDGFVYAVPVTEFDCR